MTTDYFDAEADRYDSIVRCTQEDYAVGHKALAYLAKRLLPAASNKVVNLGCGTGEEALRLCKEEVKIDALHLVDASPVMLERARRRLSRCKKANRPERVTYDVVDFAREASQNSLFERLALEKQSVDLVISAYSLHHLSISEKKSLYEQIHRHTRPEGYFINLDLFRAVDQSVQTVCRQRTMAWLRGHKMRPPKWDADDLKRWSKHILDDNVPLIFDCSGSAVNEETESDLLLKAGFTNISLPYRFFESGILVARR